MTGGEGRNISYRDISRVQNDVEWCLIRYMTKKEAMEFLHVQHNIEPIFTETVWERLEAENPNFFKAYYVRVVVKDQILEFNRLIAQQTDLMEKMKIPAAGAMLPSDGSHVSPAQQFPTPCAAQNANPLQGENLDIQHPSVLNNCGSSIHPIQPCVQGTVGGSVQSRNFNIRQSLSGPQNSNMGLTQRMNGSMGLPQRMDGNMGWAQRMNRSMVWAQTMDMSIGVAPTMNRNMGLAQMMNGNRSMGSAQAVNGYNVEAGACCAGSSSFNINPPADNLESHPPIGVACGSSYSSEVSNGQHLNNTTPLDGDASSFGQLQEIPHCSELDPGFSEFLAEYLEHSSIPTDAMDFIVLQGDGRNTDPAPQSLQYS